jgi:mannose-1-phosphate guanylyltransferase/mannose-6-phosphate isomerase
MITIIIAGGAGTRLWPLSTYDRPKQVLNLLDGESTLHKSYLRAKKISSEVYVMPEKRLIGQVREILPDLSQDHILIEPALRGTASCYVLALDQMMRKHSPQEPVAFIWADHHVRDEVGYINSFRMATDAAVRLKRLITIGVEPTYPGPLGYIERGKQIIDSNAYSVKSFKEKPEPKLATEYIRSGNYLWNTGYYVGTLETFISKIEKHSPILYKNYQKLSQIKNINSQKYHDTYLAFTNTTIELALSEKMDDLAVVPALFDWIDIGNFKDLHDVSWQDQAGNHVEGKNIFELDTSNSYLRNEEAKPLAVLGVDNVIVVNTPDGILIARRDMAPRVGEIVRKL